VVVIIDVAAACTAAIDPPMLPVVSERKKTSTSEVVGLPAVTVTILLTLEVNPVAPVAVNEVGEIESARTRPGAAKNNGPVARRSTTTDRSEAPSKVNNLLFIKCLPRLNVRLVE
jgi:hypothetical protein